MPFRSSRPVTPADPAPRLLVSVRSEDEAVAAIAGGCDLVDVKEPAAGPLGMADLDVIAAVAAYAARAERPMSVALGELCDWPDDHPVASLPPGVAFAKLGLRGERSRADWPARWRGVRDHFDAAAGRPLAWVAVIYADDEADGPDASAVLAAAAATRAAGVLVDTAAKDGRRLLDHVTPERLHGWRAEAAAKGLPFAVAGSLRTEDLAPLGVVGPDIVAVRGAVCLGHDRTGAIDSAAVARFAAVVRQTAGRGIGSREAGVTGSRTGTVRGGRSADRPSRPA